MLRRFIVFLLPVVGLVFGCAEQEASQPDPKFVTEGRELQRKHDEGKAAMQLAESVALAEQLIA